MRYRAYIELICRHLLDVTYIKLIYMHEILYEEITCVYEKTHMTAV